MSMLNAKNWEEKCDYCKHPYKHHGGGSMSCEVGSCDCAGFQKPDMKNEEEPMEKGFETNKSLATRGAMRGATQYGSVPTTMLNAREYQCSQHCNQTFNTAESARAHAEKYDCTVELVVKNAAEVQFTCNKCGHKFKTGVTYDDFDPTHYPKCPSCGGGDILDNMKKNATFRFTDSKGEVLDITAVEEENAWEQLAGKFGLSIEAVKGHGLKIERVNKGDDYSSLSDKQLKELEEHYGNALDDHRKLGDAEMSNELHKCLMNIKAERKWRGNGY